MIEEFYFKLYDLIDKHVPKKKPPSRKYPVWFNGHLIVMLKNKYKAYNAYKKCKNEENYNVFKKLRAEFKTENELAYQQYIHKIENDIKVNPNNFWSFLKSKKSLSCMPLNMKYNETNFDNPTEIVSAFADFFSKSFSETNVNSNQCKPDGIAPNSVLHLRKVTLDDVKNAISQIKANMTMGPDNIPAFLIRDCAILLAYPLCIIYNMIIENSVFPDLWKLSKVTPIFKKGDNTDITNYRPITIICNFSKLLEIILYDPLYAHVNNCLLPEQHGFISGRSTVTNLVIKTQYISEVLDQRGQVDVIYTDFSKAFDKLDHKILLHKLQYLNISIDFLNLITSYLSDRWQYVQVRGYKSKKFLQSSGVPQGSILGPLFFIIFINDIAANIDVKYLLYADDLKIFCQINSVVDCEHLQINLNHINTWCIENNLFLNVNKCNVMSYSRKQSTYEFDYKIESTPLNRPNNVKDLGVVFDPKLTFVDHINSTVTSSFKTLGFVLRNIKDFQNIDSCKLLFNCLVRSKLEYASIIWNPIYDCHITSLENIQRRFLKNLHLKLFGHYPPRGFPHDILLSTFNFNCLLKRRMTQSIIFLYKIIHNYIKCEDLHNNILYVVPRLNSRHCETFLVRTPRTNILTQSPFFQMFSNYNNVNTIIDIFNTNIRSIKQL